jgi:hypothetical protein
MGVGFHQQLSKRIWIVFRSWASVENAEACQPDGLRDLECVCACELDTSVHMLLTSRVKDVQTVPA